MLEKKTEDGRRILVMWMSGTWVVLIDGKEVTKGQLTRLEQPEGSTTHVIGEQRLALTADEAAILEEAEDRHARFAATPIGQRRALVDARDKALNKWILALEYAQEGRGDAEVAPAAAAMEAAQAAVETFDANFPYVRDEDEIHIESQVQHTIRRYLYEDL
jgi:hypothetical protein